MENLAPLTTLLSSYGSWVGLASLIAYMLFTRKKRLAETTEVEVRTAISLINELKTEVERLSGEVKSLRITLEEKDMIIMNQEEKINLINKQCPQCPLKNFKLNPKKP